MKSIIYLSDHGDRPCRPFVVEHQPDHLAFDSFKRDPRWISPRLASLSYTCTIAGHLSVHEKINHRAEYISCTASHHGLTHRMEWGGPPWGPDYRFPETEQRVARSRFRKARRLYRQRKFSWTERGYACIDLAFGLTPRAVCHTGVLALSRTEREHVQARTTLAATSRAPLPSWSLASCWDAAA